MIGEFSMPQYGTRRLPARHRLAGLPLIVACAGVFCLSGCASTGSGTAQATTTRTTSAAPAAAQTRALHALVELAAQRIMTADTVAAAKWGTDKPIDDPVREKAVLDDALAQAAKLNVNQIIVRRIFEGQISASKVVQRALYARWKASPALRPTRRPDLTTQVRPVLDRIDGQLLTAIGQAQPLLSGDSRCTATLDHEISATARTMRLDPIHQDGLRRSLAGACGPA
jgi:chorismate mutase